MGGQGADQRTGLRRASASSTGESRPQPSPLCGAAASAPMARLLGPHALLLPQLPGPRSHCLAAASEPLPEPPCSFCTQTPRHLAAQSFPQKPLGPCMHPEGPRMPTSALHLCTLETWLGTWCLGAPAPFCPVSPVAGVETPFFPKPPGCRSSPGVAAPSLSSWDPIDDRSSQEHGAGLWPCSFPHQPGLSQDEATCHPLGAGAGRGHHS